VKNLFPLVSGSERVKTILDTIEVMLDEGCYGLAPDEFTDLKERIIELVNKSAPSHGEEEPVASEKPGGC